MIILPDWKGEVVEAVGAGDTHATPAVAVLNAHGEVVGVHQSQELADAAVVLLEQAGVPEA